jgi:tetratricopeptide (TPR) repeat protein
MQPKYVEDISFLEQRIKNNPESMMFARLADRYLDNNQTDKAIELCEQGLEIHPNYASAYYILAKCFASKKEYDEAERRLKRVIKLEPKYLSAHKLYADILAEQGWTKSSEMALKKVSEIDPFFEYNGSGGGQEAFFEPSYGEKEEYPEPGTSEQPDSSFDFPFETQDREYTDQFQDPDTGTGMELDEEPQLEPAPKEQPESGEPLEFETPEPKTSSFEPPDAGSESSRETLDSDLDEDRFETPLAEPTFETKAVNDEDILTDLKGSDEIEYQPDEFEEEETRFSEILDDIFRPSLQEEEEGMDASRENIRSHFEPDSSEPETGLDESTLEEPSTEESLFQQSKDPDSQESPREQESVPPQTPPRQEIPESPEPPQREQESVQPPEPSEPLPTPFDFDEKTFKQEQDDEPLSFDSETPFESPASEHREPEPPESHESDIRDSIEPTTLDDDNFEGISIDDSFDEQEAEFSDFLSSLEYEEDDLPVDRGSDSDSIEESKTESHFESESQSHTLRPSETSGSQTPPSEMSAEPSKDKFVTPTLGEIYAAQGQYEKAIDVFELLSNKHPDNEWYHTKLDFLRKKLKEEKGRD